MPATVSCPYCKGQMAFVSLIAGQQVACPHCNRPFAMPGSPQKTMPLPNQQPAPPPPPPDAADPGSLGFLDESPAVGMPRHHHFASRKQASFWHFFDLSFRHYLTPVLIKIVWALCLALGFLAVVGSGLYTVTSMLHESGFRSAPDSAPAWDMPFTPSSPGVAKTTEVALKAVAWAIVVVVVAIALLVIRVVCESIIVLFNIAGSLSSIDGKIKATTFPASASG